MQYDSHLTEATMLKRTLGFLSEIILPGGQRAMIRCPNLGPMIGCDTLGSKIWYSNALGYHCLPTWELVEVDGGHLVCINIEKAKALVLDALATGKIKELAGLKSSHIGNAYNPQDSSVLFLESKKEKCVLGIETITFGNDMKEGLFPESIGQGRNSLQYLLDVVTKGRGTRAVLLYVVMHSGLTGVKPAALIDPEYGKMLAHAIKEGVEVLAYKITVNLHSIEITTSLPVATVAQAC